MLKIFQIAVFIFSAQVGSGVFILPSVLCGLGYKAILLFLSVGLLCTLIIKIFADTGQNSHELIGEAFGEKWGKTFFFIYTQNIFYEKHYNSIKATRINCISNLVVDRH